MVTISFFRTADARRVGTLTLDEGCVRSTEPPDLDFVLVSEVVTAWWRDNVGFGRVELGGVEYRWEELPLLDLNRVVSGTAEQLREPLSCQGIALDLCLTPTLPPVAAALPGTAEEA